MSLFRSFPVCPHCKQKVRPGDLQRSASGHVFHDDARVLATNCYNNACRDATEELGLQLVGDNVKARIQCQFFS